MCASENCKKLENVMDLHKLSWKGTLYNKTGNINSFSGYQYITFIECLRYIRHITFVMVSSQESYKLNSVILSHFSNEETVL